MFEIRFCYDQLLIKYKVKIYEIKIYIILIMSFVVGSVKYILP